MKRLIGVAVAVAMLGFGAAACSKAHNAGNDRLGVGGSSRIAAGGAVHLPQ